MRWVMLGHVLTSQIERLRAVLSGAAARQLERDLGCNGHHRIQRKHIVSTTKTTCVVFLVIFDDVQLGLVI